MATIQEKLEQAEKQAKALRALAELEGQVTGWLEEDRRLEAEETRLRRRVDEALSKLKEHRERAEVWRTEVRAAVAATGASPAQASALLSLPARLTRPPALDEDDVVEEQVPEAQEDEVEQESVAESAQEDVDESAAVVAAPDGGSRV